MTVKTFTVGNMDNKCYLVTDDAGGESALVDASFAHKSFVDEISSLKDNLKYIFLTHGHYDHILSVAPIEEATGAKVVIHKRDAICLSSPVFSLAERHGLDQHPVSADILCDDGDEISLGELTFKVIYTPGHTVGCVCYECGDALFTGDTLFRLGVGRTDLPTGSTPKMVDSLKKLYNIKGDFEVFPGHGKPSTLDVERSMNPFMKRAMSI